LTGSSNRVNSVTNLGGGLVSSAGATRNEFGDFPGQRDQSADGDGTGALTQSTDNNSVRRGIITIAIDILDINVSTTDLVCNK
jgi:hypothetical protein